MIASIIADAVLEGKQGVQLEDRTAVTEAVIEEKIEAEVELEEMENG